MIKDKERLVGNISGKQSLFGNISSKQTLFGKLNNGIEKIYPELQEKTIIPNKATQEITSDKGIYGLSKVIVEKIPDEYIIPSETKDITENGIHDVRLYENANVNVKPKLQEKTIL